LLGYKLFKAKIAKPGMILDILRAIFKVSEALMNLLREELPA
jgi:hypothetical protein